MQHALTTGLLLFFFSTCVAAYPSQCRVPCLWELWRGFSSLKSFVPKTYVPEPVYSEQSSELLAPWTISQAVEHSHQYIISLLFWDPEPSPCMSSIIFKLCICILFFFSVTIHQRQTIVARSVFFIFNHSKFKIWGHKYGNMFLIWPDGQQCLIIFVTEHSSARSSHCSLIFCLQELQITSILVSIAKSHFFFDSRGLRSFPFSQI